MEHQHPLNLHRLHIFTHKLTVYIKNIFEDSWAQEYSKDIIATFQYLQKKTKNFQTLSHCKGTPDVKKIIKI